MRHFARPLRRAHNAYCLLYGSSYATTRAPSKEYDVVIVGGALVGLAVACGLQADALTRHLRVAIIDKCATPDSMSVPRELPRVPNVRVSTITPSNTEFLQRIGVWHAVEPPRSAVFSTMQVWDVAGGGYIRWNAADIGRAYMGHVVENCLLQSALLEASHHPAEHHDATEAAHLSTVSERHSITLERHSTASSQHSTTADHSESHDRSHTATPPSFYWKTEIKQIELPPNDPDAARKVGGSPLASIHTTAGDVITARLVVAADGSNSSVRSMAGFRTWGWSYHQRGVVATVTTEPHSTAWQRFLSTGPIALLPVRDGMSNIVWSTSNEHARQLESGTADEFVAAVNNALRTPAQLPTPSLSGALGVLMPSSVPPVESPPVVLNQIGSPPQTFPLRLTHAGRYVRPRVALVGDAAHAVHPLAGQGLNLGLADAEALVDAIAHAVRHGTDIGSMAPLQERYEAVRQRSNNTMIAALETFHRVFRAEPRSMFGAARSAALDAINAVPPLKNQIMRTAMGL